MGPDDLAPMIVAVTLIIVSGGVILLRPIARRLGDLIDLAIAERRRRLSPEEPRTFDTDRATRLLEGVDQRLRLLEERQDFTDALLSSSRAESGRIPRSPPAKD